ncbi:MAG: amidase family protein [Ilumatobacteraceae bacterium]
MTALNELDAHAQQALLRGGEVSAIELLDAHLAAVDARNGDVNAIVALDADVGRRRAAAVDAALAAGDDPGRLAGLVTAHKELTETADFPTTWGSPVFTGFRPRADSLIVERMTAAGAVAIGKTNTPEFGAGSHSFNPVYGTTRNPYDPSRSAGGSSGGAAAALATHMVSIADGSDYGGSLRNPAAWNGVIGFRPSLGVIPHVDPGNAYLRLGITGPMARTVDDLTLLFGVLSRPDPRDPVNRGLDVPARVEPTDGPLRVAWSDDLGGLPIEDDVRSALRRFRTRLDDLGWTVVDAEPDFSGADECFETLRSWGMANGYVADLGSRVSEVKATIRDEIERGRALTQAQVAQAFAHMHVLWRRAVTFFGDHDLLVGPVTQLSPFPADWEYPTEVAGVPMDRYITWMRSVCRITSLQLPALSLPAGFTDAGLPVGAQLVGGPHGDLALLRAAKSVEQAS